MPPCFSFFGKNQERRRGVEINRMQFVTMPESLEIMILKKKNRGYSVTTSPVRFLKPDRAAKIVLLFPQMDGYQFYSLPICDTHV
jgi:hypothetical protein